MARKNPITSLFNKLINYFGGVVHQAKKVRWPTWQVLVKASIVVIGFAAFFAIYLGACNLIIIWMFRAIGLEI